MLSESSMTTIALNVLGVITSFLFKFIPNSYSYEKNKSNFKIPSVGWEQNGWILKELISPISGCKHRYYYHPAIKENSPVFLLLHGLFLDGRNFVKISELSDTWTLIAYDFPEVSTVYRGDMNDFKYLIDDFLDCLKIEYIYLCGVSFGGGVGIRYAASHPNRVLALVLVSTFVMNSNSTDRIKSREMSKFFFKYSDNKLYWLIEKLFKVALNGKRNPMRDIKDIVHLKKLDWYRQAVRALSTFDGLEETKLIMCPVLGVHGSDDRTIPLKKAYSIPKCIPQANFEIIKNGTHAMIYLQGSEIAEKIRRFCITIMKDDSRQKTI